MSEPAVVAVGLTKRYGGQSALRDTSFRVAAGRITGFIGRNGAGKTTTLRIVSTLLTSDEGQCTVLGHDARRDRWKIRQRLGFLPDTFELPSLLTLREYLRVFADLYGISRADRDKRINTTLQLTRTEEYSERRLDALSRGEQQRVGLARALIHNPDLLLLDEPAANLDPHARVELKELLRLLKDKGKTVLLSSHILADLEEICDDLIVIRRGAIVFCGEMQAFRDTMRSSVTWRLVTVSGEPMIPSTIGGDVTSTGPHSIQIAGDLTPHERARWIADLVQRGIPVCELSREETSLEQEFARALEEEQP